MRFEDDVYRDTFEVECIEGDNSSDAVADKWPRCKPGKENVIQFIMQSQLACNIRATTYKP